MRHTGIAVPVSYAHTTRWDIYRYSSASELCSHNKDWSVLNVQQAHIGFCVNETKCMLDTAKRLSGPCAKNPKTHAWVNLDSRQWQNTASRQVITLTAVAPHCQPEHEVTSTVHEVLPHKAAAEMQLNATNFNTASGFILRWVWYTVTEMLIKTQDQAQYVTLPTSPHWLSSQPTMRQRFG
jgi:hypothetical protein